MVADITSGVGPGYSIHAQTIAANGPRTDFFPRAVQGRELQNEPLREATPNNDGSRVAQSAGVFAQIRGRQELLNQSALELRDLGAVVEKSGQILGEMDKELTIIVKMFPPYPVDNPERISLLNSFGGLRKQIEGLTFPPPEELDALGRVLKPEAYSSYPGNEESDNLRAQLIKHPMWDNIPALDSKSASDDEIKYALERVKLLATSLGEFSRDAVLGVFKKINESDEVSFGGKLSDVRDQLARLESEGGKQGKTGIGGDVLRLEQAVGST